MSKRPNLAILCWMASMSSILSMSSMSASAAEAAARAAAPLKVVGVLGNSAGMSDRPVPYAFYTGIAVDGRGRVYLAGADEGIPVCDQDGHCLAVLPLPQAEGMAVRSVMVRAGDSVFFVAGDGGGSRAALYRIRTAPAAAGELTVERIAAGPGTWAISPTLDPAGNVIVGQSDVGKLKYTVLAVDPASGQARDLFAVDEPKGSMRPWRHTIQAEPDGCIAIDHQGGVNWKGRFDAAGTRVGDPAGGQLLDGLRYHFGYEGEIRRTDVTGTKPAPGECGSPAAEIRMPAQVARDKDRFFFAGRGGALEARWNGSNFDFTRRIGGLYLEDLAAPADGGELVGVAFTNAGNNDVQHFIRIPKSQPIGERLDAQGPIHSHVVRAVVATAEGEVAVWRDSKGVGVMHKGPQHLQYDVHLEGVKEVGQAAAMGKDLLLADPASGVIWRRPLADKQAPATAWSDKVPGVMGLAVAGEAVYAASAKRVVRLSADGKTEQWACPVEYQGVRRLAAAGEFLYVCDTAAHVVDQLDAATGRQLARLGEAGQAGSALDRLRRPNAVAADLNAVYVADGGNGRVLVATTSMWRPDIRPLPRQQVGPIVALTIPVKLPAPAAPTTQPTRISLNIYDANDVTVRQLVCAAPSDAPITWDGRDQYGQFARPGTYRWHAIAAPKLGLKYVMSIGQSGTPPYRTADGKGSWGGVWGDVMDICTVTNEPDSDIVVLWAVEEGEGGLVRMSQDGQVRWKQHLDWWMKAAQTAVTSDGTSIYIVASSAMNAPQGQADYHGEWNRPMLWRVDAATGAKRLYSQQQNDQPMFGEYLKEGRIVTDVAVHDGKLYITAPAQNTLFVADAKTGKQLAAWKIDGVSGAGLAGDRKRLIVGSGSKIVELDPAGGGKVAAVLADVGGEVWDVEGLPGGGFVASVGGTRNQVVYFDAKGKQTRAVGNAGGRPRAGGMQPESFRNPTGLCVTGGGRLFVADSAAPRRFTRWSADGKFERQFHGPYYYSGMFGVDEDNPDYVYGDTHSDLIRYKVNYGTGQWDVDHYWIGAYDQSGVPIKWWPRIRHKDGRTLWCSGSGAIAELLDDRVRGVAAVYGGWVAKTDAGDPRGYESMDWKKKTKLKGTWSDLNGDGVKQAGEWQVTDKPVYPAGGSGPQQGWGAYFDEKFNLFMHDWSDDANGGVWEIPVAEWKGGAPVYRWDQARHVGLPRYHGLQHGASGARTAFAYQGAAYGLSGGYNAAHLPGVGHGGDWEFAQITKYDRATGKPLWHAGERAASFVTPGQTYCPTGAAGVIGDYLFWTDENSLVHVWDNQHGLYVDTLLEDCSRGPDPSPYTVWVELFNTRVFRHPATGKVYLLAASDAIHVYEVLGTDQRMQREQGQCVLTQADIDRAKAQEASRTPAKERTATIARAAAPVKLDGDQPEFANVVPLRMVQGPAMQAEARMLYDDQCLYLSVDVKDDSPWKNAGGDPTALFKTGDAVSLWVGPSAGKRQVGPGDVRLLFAPAAAGGEKVTVVSYRPKLAQGAKPVTFRSPSSAVTLDRVEELTDIPAVVKVSEKGYRLVAAIPWSKLGGLSPTAERFGLDLSVDFSDPAGQRNVCCLRWGRNGAAIVYDLPTEARFEPETWGAGVLDKPAK